MISREVAGPGENRPAESGSFRGGDIFAAPQKHDVVRLPVRPQPSVPSEAPHVSVQPVPRPRPVGPERTVVSPAEPSSKSEAGAGTKEQGTEKKSPAAEAASKVRQHLADAHSPNDPIHIQLERTRALNWIEDAAEAGVFDPYTPGQEAAEVNPHLVNTEAADLYGAIADGTLQDGKPYSASQMADITNVSGGTLRKGIETLRTTGIFEPWHRKSGDPVSPQKGFKISTKNMHAVAKEQAEPVQDSAETGNIVADAITDLHKKLAEVETPNDPMALRLHRTIVLNAIDKSSSSGMFDPLQPGEKRIETDEHTFPPAAVSFYEALTKGDLAEGELYSRGRLQVIFKLDENEARNGLVMLRQAGVASIQDSGNRDGVFVPAGYVFHTRNIHILTPEQIAEAEAEKVKQQNDARDQAALTKKGMPPRPPVNDLLVELVREELADGYRDPRNIATVYGLDVTEVKEAIALTQRKSG